MPEIGEFYMLDLSEWEPVKQHQGKDKGMNPTVNKNGSVFISKNREGEEVRVFVRKVKTENKGEGI
jgi:hypothetical protein